MMNKLPTLADFNSELDFLTFVAQKIDLFPKDQQRHILARLETLQIEAARTSFLEFVKLMGPTLMPGFVMGRHIELIANRLTKLLDNAFKPAKGNPTDRWMLSLPPGGAKSQIVTRMFPAWALGVKPETRFIIVGHGIEFATDEYGAKIRDIMWSEEYKKIFPDTELRPDKQSAGRFLTTQGGEVLCTGIEAAVAGRRGHVILVDDAIVEDKALSKTVREKLVKDYPSKHRSRLFMNYAGAEIINGTRWCQGDLHDYLETIDKNSASPWEVWRVPAILDQTGQALLRREGDPKGYLEEGTSFWPEFQPTDRLMSIRSSYENNMARWNAVYMQDPTPDHGSILKADSFKKWTKNVRPPIHTLIISADTAYTKETYSDPSAFVVVGLWNDSFGSHRPVTNAILIDYIVKKLSYIELVDVFASLYAKHKPDFILVEEAASGLAIIPELRKRGYPVRSFKTKKDKIMKANSVAPIIDSGRFFVPMPEGNMAVVQKTQEFLTEMAGFPDRPHDDLVDAVTNLLLYLKEQNILAPDAWQDVEPYEPHDEDSDDSPTSKGTYYKR